MWWLALILAVIGYVLYFIDKRIKAKFEDKFNPHDWDLPRSVELTNEIKPQPVSVRSDNVQLNYIKKPSVFSDTQHAIFNALQRALASEYILLTNINVIDVLTINAQNNTLAVQTATKNLAAKQFDFVVCDKTQLTAMCVIVLGDRLEPTLVNACDTAQLPLARFKIQASYDVAVIRTSLLNAMGRVENIAPSTYESALEITDVSAVQPEQKNDAISAQDATLKIDVSDSGAPLCPQCSAIMLKRKAKSGIATGQLFWICSTYPKCRGVIPVK